ncbi:MAG: thiolase family protein [Wenyingzhuangia sp.]|uniref:thiolase family protein n=1 Tax=Wenyingzhuangia sp. TaxID=1964193 RepID=UPI00321BDB7E
MSDQVYIISAIRTPMGAFGGALSKVSATDLGAVAIEQAVKKAQIDKEKIETIVMGNVLSANLGQAPARQASMAAGLPENVCATTINKVCASGMKAISVIFNDIKLKNYDVGIAGGMENMSLVPHYISNSRTGMSFGHSTLIDGMLKDGLTDVYNQTSMGVSGDKTADKYEITREQQDEYAIQSYVRSKEAWDKGVFEDEIAPVRVPQRKGDPVIVSEDETYKQANFEKMKLLRPAFSENGTVTAANASSINDGASAVVVASESFVENENIMPMAKIVAYAEAEQDPTFFTTTPILATKKVLEKANLTLSDIDFFEVNEAFAVVPLAFMNELKIEVSKVNVFGGAVSLGHPLGSSGSRIVVTLLNVLKNKKAKYGLATICNGGGGASALIIENLSHE